MRPFVLFDLDDTLVNQQKTLRIRIARLRARLRLVAGIGARTSAEIAMRLLEWGTRRRGRSCAGRLRERGPLSESVAELRRCYRVEQAGLMSCPSVVLAGLDDLRARGWLVGVVTNGPADVQEVKLRRTGIVERVDACCISGEFGVHKPDVAVFIEAMRRCGAVQADGGWMVGDNPLTDIAGGRAAGLRTIWVSAGRPWPGPGPKADLVVRDAAAAIGALLALDALG